jgi:hypothetical protein
MMHIFPTKRSTRQLRFEDGELYLAIVAEDGVFLPINLEVAIVLDALDDHFFGT